MFISLCVLLWKRKRNINLSKIFYLWDKHDNSRKQTMLWRDDSSKTSHVWQLCNSLVGGQYSGCNQVLFKYSCYLHIVPSQSSWNKRKDARISRSISIHHHHLNLITIIIINTFKFCKIYCHGVCSGNFLVNAVAAVLQNFLHFKLTWGWGSRH